MALTLFASHHDAARGRRARRRRVARGALAPAQAVPARGRARAGPEARPARGRARGREAAAATRSRRREDEIRALDEDVALALAGGKDELARFAIRRLLPRRAEVKALAARIVERAAEGARARGARRGSSSSSSTRCATRVRAELRARAPSDDDAVVGRSRGRRRGGRARADAAAREPREVRRDPPRFVRSERGVRRRRGARLDAVGRPRGTVPRRARGARALPGGRGGALCGRAREEPVAAGVDDRARRARRRSSSRFVARGAPELCLALAAVLGVVRSGLLHRRGAGTRRRARSDPCSSAASCSPASWRRDAARDGARRVGIPPGAELLVPRRRDRDARRGRPPSRSVRGGVCAGDGGARAPVRVKR